MTVAFYYSPTCIATASGPTGAGGQSAFANTGIPTIIGAFVAATGSIIGGLIARNMCCSNKCKCKYAFNSFSYCMCECSTHDSSAHAYFGDQLP